MTDQLATLPSYAETRRRIPVSHAPISKEEPVRVPVVKRRPGTMEKHYPRKAKARRKFDFRKPRFY